jgi:L-aminopeptidase/D-esterase-like protein
MRYLEEQGVGYDVGVGRLPLVPAAVLFDLDVGDARVRPDAQAGYAACCAASGQRPAEGNVGAGAGATVGKMFGMDCAMKSGIGTASVSGHGVTVGALVACNALGDVVDPHTGTVLAGARTEDGQQLRNSRLAVLGGDAPWSPLAGANTTIGVVATDAVLSKPQAHRLAVMAHDGLARVIHPVHTPLDGDTLFTLATGTTGKTVSMLVLGVMAAEATLLATLRAVRCARSLSLPPHHWPGLDDSVVR